jgi:transposase
MARLGNFQDGAMMATVLQGYQFALDPSPRQRVSLASHTGAARFAYSWGLELVTARLRQRRTDPSVQLPWTRFELQRQWNHAKYQVAPWWAENSKEAYKSGLDALAQALQNWSDSRSARRKGRPVGFPRRKKKRRAALPAGSPPAPSGSCPTASTSSCQGSAWSGRMSPPGSWRGG